MSNKAFAIAILVFIVAIGGYVFKANADKPKEVILGIQHKNQGQDHITEGQKHAAYNSDPASSGPHRNDAQAPALWGVYTTELTPEIFVHNEEHGGIVVTYNPKLLSADQLKKLQDLFAPPYSDAKFTPTKALVMPREADTHAIEVAAWTWTYNMDSYNQNTLEKFYLQHEGKSPEPTAGPTNTPFNQAAH
jgi:hypothetical protein